MSGWLGFLCGIRGESPDEMRSLERRVAGWNSGWNQGESHREHVDFSGAQNLSTCHRVTQGRGAEHDEDRSIKVLLVTEKETNLQGDRWVGDRGWSPLDVHWG